MPLVALEELGDTLDTLALVALDALLVLLVLGVLGVLGVLVALLPDAPLLDWEQSQGLQVWDIFEHGLSSSFEQAKRHGIKRKITLFIFKLTFWDVLATKKPPARKA